MPKKSVSKRLYVQTVHSVQKPRKKRGSPTQLSYLTIPEKDRLFQAIKAPRDRAIFRVMYHHGLRASEIGRLDLSDFRQGSKIDLDRIFIHRLKGSISGETGMVPAAAQAIRGWLRIRGIAEGPLFITRNKTRIGRKWIFALMRRYCAIAQIPLEKRHPHVLKHSCATHLISDKREPVVEVQKHLGHASIKNTMIYAELTGEANEARAKRLRDWR